MPRPLTPLDTKVCEVCGREYPRPRYRNGELQPRKAWEDRRACGSKCGARLGGRISAAPAHAASVDHAPCPICGDAITRREDEPLFRYRARATCGKDACYRAHMSVRVARAGKPKAPKAQRKPPPPKAPKVKAKAPPRRTEFERFPTPRGMRSTWASVISANPPLPLVRPTPQSHTGPTPELQEALQAAIDTHPALEAAIDMHPALKAALTGLLSDSWAPFGTTAVRPGPLPRR